VLNTHETVAMSSNALLWLRFALGGLDLALYATVEADRNGGGGGSASGQVRFETMATPLNSEQQRAVERALGVPVSDVLFEVVPLLSTPCDLYALAVLCVRTLLVGSGGGGGRGLPSAMADVLELALRTAALDEEQVDLGLTVRGVLEEDDRLLEALGPQRLTDDGLSVSDALNVIPMQAWCGVLAAVLRMLPGDGPSNVCSSLGDARASGIHRVFDRAASDLIESAVGVRALLFSDRAADQEIVGVIRSVMAGV
jgi:hypothetical protein